jgi:peroxiredoxin Q/BCP
MPEIGKKAPAFTCPNQDGEKIKLNDLKGKKVVLFAYPKAATSGCTKQARGFRDNMDCIEAAGAVVLGISPDSPETLRRWREKEKIPYDFLSDPDHVVLEKYGAWGEKKLYGRTYEGVLRSHFIIDENGRLVDQQIKVGPDQSVERALAFLDAATA